MTSIALGVFIIFIVYVMIWSIRNDGAKSIRDQTGLIKMRVPEGAEVDHSDDTKVNQPSNSGTGSHRRTQTYGASRAVTKNKGRHDVAGTSPESSPPSGRPKI